MENCIKDSVIGKKVITSETLSLMVHGKMYGKMVGKITAVDIDDENLVTVMFDDGVEWNLILGCNCYFLENNIEESKL